LMFAWPIVRSIQAESKLPASRPVLGSVPEFSLTDQAEGELSTQTLRGIVWIASFSYTACDGCQHTMNAMRKIQHRIRGLGQSIKLVTLTLDPNLDAPEIFSQYAQDQRASSRIWSFASGPADQLDPIYDAFGVTRAPQMRVFLVDGQSEIRGFYDLSDPAAEDLLIRDAGLLINRGY